MVVAGDRATNILALRSTRLRPNDVLHLSEISLFPADLLAFIPVAWTAINPHSLRVGAPLIPCHNPVQSVSRLPVIGRALMLLSRCRQQDCQSGTADLDL
jgi:hypothetical protein